MVRLVIVDQDGGVDDALALMMILSQPDVHVLAVTCVSGNVPVDLACTNVGRILQQCGPDSENIPVYRGADRPIVREITRGHQYHGTDGLGNAGHLYPLKDSWRGPEQEHAVLAMIRLTEKYSGQVSLLALGPLTNVALACRLDVEFASHLKDIVIVGGNIKASGSVSLSADFNFYADPEAARIVLHACCKPTLITLESKDTFVLDIGWCNEWLNVNSHKAKFAKDLLGLMLEYNRQGSGSITLYDPAAVALFLHPKFVTEKKDVSAHVECAGMLTRGRTVIDWFGVEKREPNVTIATKYNVDILKQLLIEAVT
jgi:inosine-uridine nucleoside N-ribohydrolase